LLPLAESIASGIGAKIAAEYEKVLTERYAPAMLQLAAAELELRHTAAMLRQIDYTSVTRLVGYTQLAEPAGLRLDLPKAPAADGLAARAAALLGQLREAGVTAALRIRPDEGSADAPPAFGFGGNAPPATTAGG
jgi:hypothetical protein